ncbi:MAG: Sir2 family NAD-dependent protein deacetylase [Dethiobacter sp.]|nr:Sir2 family NAD-dependent protein deacetylase [Dethiobacter sp.]MBS3898271.1 Sir2 family NAD-dependent protein deacetylase [Dethiobacter sp.]MBS3983356.1 Sir2 family NAD-dependent protein deacetylase [Dethiobacter sp.]
MSLDVLVKKAARILRGAKYTVVLTGAGISTESGIPDFRSPGTGLWEKEDPAGFTIDSFCGDPRAFYRRILPLLRLIEQALPNEGHKSLALLEGSGMVKAVITQNIDGLHQAAGSARVFEVHGSFKKGTCLSCHKKHNLALLAVALERGEEPACLACGGAVKPDVILFGEELPPAFQLAQREALKCDCMLVVGSSLQVAPVGYLPRYSKNLLIINRGNTPYDDLARVVINQPAGEVLPLLVAELGLQNFLW